MATRSGLCGLASAGLVITCEHGGNRIPAPYRDLFHAHQALLDSHRGMIPARSSWQERWQRRLQRRWWPPP